MFQSNGNKKQRTLIKSDVTGSFWGYDNNNSVIVRTPSEVVDILQAELKEAKEELLKTKSELVDTKAKLVKTEQKLLATSNVDSRQKDVAISSGDEDEALTSQDPNDSAWVSRYLELRAYRIMHGDCKVPTKSPVYPRLGRWVDSQRKAYTCLKTGKKGGPKITQDRIDKLDSLGFYWGKKFPVLVPWEDQYNEVKKFKHAIGNCNIPIHPTHPSPLAKWVSYQRVEYKRFQKGRDSLLTLEQIGKLNEIGFSWSNGSLVK